MTQGYDANLLILSIDQLQKIKHNTPTDAVNLVSEAISNKTSTVGKTVTYDGKTYSPEEFMLKYQGDNVSYGYLVDGGAYNVVKFDKNYNFACEFVIEPGLQAFTIKYVTTDDVKGWIKDKLFTIELD